MHTAALLAIVSFVPVMPQDPAPATPRTAAEQSGWKRTCTHAELLSFLGELAKLPHAERLWFHAFGQSGEGKELRAVLVAEPMPRDDAAIAGSDKLRVLINANIHAGEVEGKEATQLLLRELAQGEHADLLRNAILVFVPDFNPDGNDRIDVHHRVSQNGPDGGVGTRENAAGLDLNRDFVKLESPEGKALVQLMAAFDPHLVMDLHTTDGSYHGYHVTYATSLCTNVDPRITALARDTLIPKMRAALLAQRQVRTFDYGNFEGRGAARHWVTFDHTPRYLTNYVGLHNRISLLCETYSYLPFQQRVAVARAFVLEALATAVAHVGEIRTACKAADAAASHGERIALGYDTELAPAVDGEVLVGGVERVELPDLGTRLIAKDSFEAVKMPVQSAFRSKESLPLPRAWAILQPSAAVRETLAAHGLSSQVLAASLDADVEISVPRKIAKAARMFQGHHTVELSVEMQPRHLTIPAGALLVPASQPLARLAAELLEARSEDSLATWSYFDDATRVPKDEQLDGQAPPFPVLRILRAELPPVAATMQLPFKGR